MTNSIEADLRAHASAEKAEQLQKYFKTGPGEYGAGDVFIGLTVPQVRTVAKKYNMLPFGEIKKLLASSIHEYRLCGFEILVGRYEREPDMRVRIYDFYLENLDRANNWDLIDGSAPYIIGEHLLDKSHKILYEFARSPKMWERRVAIISTFAFIRKEQYADTLAIAEILLSDDEDLIHKAVGWGLREVGKRNKTVLTGFLRTHAHHMPRTMLRYSIEHFSDKERQTWMGLGKTRAAREEIFRDRELASRDKKTAEPFSHRTSALFERVKRENK